MQMHGSSSVPLGFQALVASVAPAVNFGGSHMLQQQHSGGQGIGAASGPFEWASAASTGAFTAGAQPMTTAPPPSGFVFGAQQEPQQQQQQQQPAGAPQSQPYLMEIE